MICPICQTRKPKRFCPAKFEQICSVCCGEQREVTIDCPSDCPHLVASREYDEERRSIEWGKLPFPDQNIPFSVLELHQELFYQLAFIIAECATENPSLVDSDIHIVLKALAETWQTLAKGLIFENPPTQPILRELYDRLKRACKEYRRREDSGLVAAVSMRDSETRDLLILFAQTAAMHSNDRPKGRAFLDFSRSQFEPGTFAQPAASRILVTGS
ncbi:MAG: hypothetical protein ACRD1N_04405 [Terriglobia bacterium]